ncbi:MAG: hypothetical protein L6416_12345 [Candidatus Omnitrophica bacterium]|nr:hypothetical protein [Candidatus Omnitrophota bacterium]
MKKELIQLTAFILIIISGIFFMPVNSIAGENHFFSRQNLAAKIVLEHSPFQHVFECFNWRYFFESGHILHIRSSSLLRDIAMILYHQEGIKIYLGAHSDKDDDRIFFDGPVHSIKNISRYLRPFFKTFVAEDVDLNSSKTFLKKKKDFHYSILFLDRNNIPIKRADLTDFFNRFFLNQIRNDDGLIIDISFSGAAKDSNGLNQDDMRSIIKQLGYDSKERELLEIAGFKKKKKKKEKDIIAEFLSNPLYMLMIKEHTPDYKSGSMKKIDLLESAI